MSELSGKDLIAIIKACDSYGVASFKAGDVEITFGAQAPSIPSVRVKKVPLDPEQEAKTEAELKAIREENEREALMYDDPAEFERRFIKGAA